MKQIQESLISHTSACKMAKEFFPSLLKEKEVAVLLNVTPSCLQAWRYRGEGPNFIKISGKCVRYRWIDLQEWINGHRHSSTSQYKEGEIS